MNSLEVQNQSYDGALASGVHGAETIDAADSAEVVVVAAGVVVAAVVVVEVDRQDSY
jgi:hypothetical protein